MASQLKAEHSTCHADETSRRALLSPIEARRLLIADLMPSILHELCQPLTAAALHADSARRALSAEDGAERLAASLAQTSAEFRRAACVVESLHALTGANAEVVPLLANEIVEQVDMLVRLHLHASGKLLVLDLAPDVPLVLAARATLLDVIMRVVVLAARSLGPRKTKIIARTDLVTSDTVRLTIGIEAPPGFEFENALFDSSELSAALDAFRSGGGEFLVEDEHVVIELPVQQSNVKVATTVAVL